MDITFSLGHVFSPDSSPAENAYVLKTLLEALIAIDLAYLKTRRGTVPRLYSSGVRYARTKSWDSIPDMYGKRYGDCKSLSAALIAQYRQQGLYAVPEFRFVNNASGGQDYHILVRCADGSAEDPSAKLGMGSNELRWFGL